MKKRNTNDARLQPRSSAALENLLSTNRRSFLRTAGALVVAYSAGRGGSVRLCRQIGPEGHNQRARRLEKRSSVRFEDRRYVLWDAHATTAFFERASASVFAARRMAVCTR